MSASRGSDPDAEAGQERYCSRPRQDVHHANVARPMTPSRSRTASVAPARRAGTIMRRGLPRVAEVHEESAMTEPTYNLVSDDTLAAYGAALAGLVGLMLRRLAREQPGVSRKVAGAYRTGDVRLRLVTTLAHGAQHELALCALDSRGNESTLATVVVSASVLD